MQNELYFKTQLDKFRSDTKFPLRVKIEKPQTVTVSHQHEFCECIFVIARVRSPTRGNPQATRDSSNY